MTFTYTVFVEADNEEYADQVMSERINYAEDYGFEYSVWWTP